MSAFFSYSSSQGTTTCCPQHYAINHSENFISPKGCEVHTQNVQGIWKDMEWVKLPGIRSQFLYQYLACYSLSKMHELVNLLHPFFMQTTVLYPPQGTKQQQVIPLVPDSSDKEGSIDD